MALKESADLRALRHRHERVDSEQLDKCFRQLRGVDRDKRIVPAAPHREGQASSAPECFEVTL